MRKTVSALVPLVAVCCAAAAADAPSFKLSNPNAPVEYSAEECHGEQKAGATEGMLMCTGNVMIRQGEVRLRADAVRIHFLADRKVDKIVAQGRVAIDSPSGTATGDAGLYDVVPRIVTLTGSVVLVKEDSVVRGDTLRVDLVSGIANLGGAEQGGRIQGLFTPKSSVDGKK